MTHSIVWILSDRIKSARAKLKRAPCHGKLALPRLISGFLLESEMNENGQDGVERRIANQSIVPNPSDGYAYPDGLFNPDGSAEGNTPGQPILGTIAGDNRYTGAGQSFFDNGVYNLGVTRCEADQTHVTGICDDVGRGGNDAFGWPLSLATLLLKDLGGPVQEPGQPLLTFDSNLGPFGGLFEESAQDQQINPGVGGDPVASQLPAYLGPWVNQINVGDSMPELDEVFGGINTLTDVPMLEGFIDVLGPNAFSGRQGTWRVSISGSRAADNWDLRVEGPNGFERSYSLSRSASEHEPEAICAIVLRLVPPVQA